MHVHITSNLIWTFYISSFSNYCSVHNLYLIRTSLLKWLGFETTLIGICITLKIGFGHVTLALVIMDCSKMVVVYGLMIRMDYLS